MGYNYAARLCLAAAIDIQHGEIVGWKVEPLQTLACPKNAKTEKKKKTPEGGFSAESKELFRIPGL